MPQFITRVELHGAGHNEPIYQILHSAMEGRGFRRTIRGEHAMFHMLTAEYEITGNYSTRTVMVAAQQAATETNLPHSVFVSEVVNYSFYNLRQV